MIGKTNSLIKNAIALEFDCSTQGTTTYNTGLKIDNVKKIALQYKTQPGVVVSECDTVSNNALNKEYATTSAQTGTNFLSSLVISNGYIHFVQQVHGGVILAHVLLTAYY